VKTSVTSPADEGGSPGFSHLPLARARARICGLIKFTKFQRLRRRVCSPPRAWTLLKNVSLIAPLRRRRRCFSPAGRSIYCLGVRNIFASDRRSPTKIPGSFTELTRRRKSCDVCFQFRTSGNLSRLPKYFEIMPLKIRATNLKTSVTFLLSNGGPSFFPAAEVRLRCASLTPICSLGAGVLEGYGLTSMRRSASLAGEKSRSLVGAWLDAVMGPALTQEGT
jgi:hypothetical protein